MGSCILNWTRSQFWGGRKPECSEKTLETRSTYNIVVEVEGVIDVHWASLTSQGVQHRVFYLDGHPSRYQPRPTGLNFGEQTGTGVFPFGDSRTSSKYYNENTSTTPVETINKDTRLFLFQSVVSSAVAQKSISLRKDGYCTGVIIIFSTDTSSSPAPTKLICTSYENRK